MRTILGKKKVKIGDQNLKDTKHPGNRNQIKENRNIDTI